MFNVSKLMSLWKSLRSSFTLVFDKFKYFKLNRVNQKSGSLLMPEPSRSKALRSLRIGGSSNLVQTKIEGRFVLLTVPDLISF